MRILFAVHGYKPAYRLGGPIISVSELAEALVAKGHSVVVATTTSNLDRDLDVPANRPTDVNGVEVWYFARQEYIQRAVPFIPYVSRSIGFLYAPRMRAALDDIVPQVDVVHTHMPFTYPSFAAARAAFRFKKPLFYHQRGVFDPERLRFRSAKKRAYIRLVERPIMRQAHTLIALTEAETDGYRALGIDTPVAVIPNGVTVARYRAVPCPGSMEKWGITPDDKVVLFLARIHPLKGAHRLLDAFPVVQGAHPDAVLVLAGPDEWGLEKRFKAHAGTGRVLFPGMLMGEDKLDLLARADLFCLPSDAEGFSMSVLEAMASGTAVLLSPGCHFPEVAQQGAGVIVDNAPELLGRALAKLLADPAHLAEMGRRGRALVLRDYDWTGIADKTLELYEAALRGRT